MIILHDQPRVRATILSYIEYFNKYYIFLPSLWLHCGCLYIISDTTASKVMVAKLNNELLSTLSLLNSSQDAISSEVEGALKRISDNEEKGIILTRLHSMRCVLIEETSWLWSYGKLVLPEQSVPITNTFVNLNPAHDEVYSIQHYVMKFASDLRQVGGFSLPIKLITTA